jgi:hypothetical protein
MARRRQPWHVLDEAQRVFASRLRERDRLEAPNHTLGFRFVLGDERAPGPPILANGRLGARPRTPRVAPHDDEKVDDRA